MAKFIRIPCAYPVTGMNLLNCILKYIFYMKKKFPALYHFSYVRTFFRMWKKSQYCPECNICFGRENFGDRGKSLFDAKSTEVEYAFCWVCSRQHHAKCIGDAPRFICGACQRKTQEKCMGLAGNVTNVASQMSAAAANNTSSSNVLNFSNVNFNMGSSSSSRPSRRSGIS